MYALCDYFIYMFPIIAIRVVGEIQKLHGGRYFAWNATRNTWLLLGFDRGNIPWSTDPYWGSLSYNMWQAVHIIGNDSTK